MSLSASTRSSTKSRSAQASAISNAKYRTCGADSCKKAASFGHKNGRAQFCDSHKLAGMRNLLKWKWCTEDECSERATHNLRDRPTPRHCALHAEEGMVDVVNLRWCKALLPGGQRCLQRAVYGYRGEKGRARACQDHMEVGMLDVEQRTCRHPRCSTRTPYGVAFCVRHRPQDQPGQKRASLNLDVAVDGLDSPTRSDLGEHMSCWNSGFVPPLWSSVCKPDGHLGEFPPVDVAELSQCGPEVCAFRLSNAHHISDYATGKPLCGCFDDDPVAF